MKIQDFEEVNIKIAEHQPQYETVPAYLNKKEGSLTYCFKFTEEDLKRLKENPVMYFKQYTKGAAMQPIYPTTIKSEVIPE